MDKSKKVRMSKWHVIPLDENQLMYAAIDVYVSLRKEYVKNIWKSCRDSGICKSLHKSGLELETLIVS